MLTNPKYIAANISNYRSFKLKHLSLVRGDRGSRFAELHSPRVILFIRVGPEILEMRDAEQERR